MFILFQFIRLIKLKKRLFIPILLLLVSNYNFLILVWEIVEKKDESVKKAIFLVIILLFFFYYFENYKVLKVEAAISSEVWVSTPSEVEDAFVSSQSPTTNYSTSQYLVVGKHQTFAITRSFLKFKLPTLPKGAVITSA